MPDLPVMSVGTIAAMGVRAKLTIAVIVAAIVAIGVWTTLREKQPAAAPAKATCPTAVRAAAYEDEPQRPLRRDGFERLFQAGTTVRAGGKEAKVDVVEVARLDLPTGRLVAVDPSYGGDVGPAFLVTVTPGSYPVSLARVRFAADPGHTRIAAAKLLVRDEPVTRWQLALVPGEDPAKLGPNEYYGYGVDGGLGSFLDASAAPSLCRLVGDGLDGPLMKALLPDDHPPGVSLRDPATGPNVIAFESGWGDGSYPTWIGYTAGGAVAQFVTDFDVID